MKIKCTDIQWASFCEQHEQRPTLCYSGRWYWETPTDQWVADVQDVVDALLERVLVLESELMDLRHRVQLGDALQRALQAQELLDQMSCGETRYRELADE